MYRRCIICGWGRKDCIEDIKFYCIPKNPGLQKMQWMQVLSDKVNQDERAGSFKKIDSICSLHFKSGKPSTNPDDVDFVPSVLLNPKDITDELKRKYHRKFTDDSEKVKKAREARLTKLNERMRMMKELTEEQKAGWVQRLQAKKQERGEDINQPISASLESIVERGVPSAEEDEPPPEDQGLSDVDEPPVKQQRMPRMIPIMRRPMGPIDRRLHPQVLRPGETQAVLDVLEDEEEMIYQNLDEIDHEEIIDVANYPEHHEEPDEDEHIDVEDDAEYVEADPVPPQRAFRQEATSSYRRYAEEDEQHHYSSVPTHFQRRGGTVGRRPYFQQIHGPDNKVRQVILQNVPAASVKLAKNNSRLLYREAAQAQHEEYYEKREVLGAPSILTSAGYQPILARKLPIHPTSIDPNKSKATYFIKSKSKAATAQPTPIDQPSTSTAVNASCDK